ncbi:acyl carrier protein [Couchioplanes caeruleus]|uniref:Acyl carrier protein n=2 Tax=Couchioplanes caeruleus TaxID=56438 RepID=A0A1K0GTH7_9ACTN|nr:acyl carrier protein [Couchioplanes caeruleus]OJF15766.1 Acyl carrier protein [Couchioplanes caeruleus subsp. caeruleus]ROP31263.1 acyl carrier protein [Couchioplanes caeruleus]
MRLADVVADVFEVDPADVVDEATPATLENWTSLRHIQLVVALEAAYGVSFSSQEIRGFKSVGDVRRALADKGTGVDEEALA